MGYWIDSKGKRFDSYEEVLDDFGWKHNDTYNKELDAYLDENYTPSSMYNLLVKGWDVEDFDQSFYEYLYDKHYAESGDIKLCGITYKWVKDSGSKDKKPKAKKKCASKCTKPMVKSIPKKAPAKKVVPKRR